jgi:hypothetical protein
MPADSGAWILQMSQAKPAAGMEGTASRRIQQVGREAFDAVRDGLFYLSHWGKQLMSRFV